jgi:hypothetical protein
MTRSLPIEQILIPGLEVENRLDRWDRCLLVHAARVELNAEFFQLTFQLNLSCANTVLKVKQLVVVEPNWKTRVDVRKVAESYEFIALVA